MESKLYIKMAVAVFVVLIIGVSAGLMLLCGVNNPPDICKRKILLFTRNMILALFVTVLASIGLLIYLKMSDLPLVFDEAFLAYLGFVLISSAISFKVSGTVINAFDRSFEKTLDKAVNKISDDSENNTT